MEFPRQKVISIHEVFPVYVCMLLDDASDSKHSMGRRKKRNNRLIIDHPNYPLLFRWDRSTNLVTINSF